VSAVTTPLLIVRSGLVTSVGLDCASSCAAVRSKLTQPSATRVTSADGTWLAAHQVALPPSVRGVERLALMAARAIGECVDGLASNEVGELPILLCISESTRPGRHADLERELVARLELLLGRRLAAGSTVVARGRVSVPVALAAATHALVAAPAARVLIVAVDSLTGAPEFLELDRSGRLLTPYNTDGFIAGEAAGALLVSSDAAGAGLACVGLGFAIEPAPRDSALPLRASGLSDAIRQALAQADCELHELDYRIADVAGEQYFFKEAALALLRTLRTRRDVFDLWHPAECVGEVGAASGAVMLAVAMQAARKRYAPGPGLLAHWSNDGGERAAAVLRWKEAA